MKNLLLILFACAIMWLLSQSLVYLREISLNIEGIRRALEPHSEPHVLFRVSPELRAEPETLVL